MVLTLPAGSRYGIPQAVSRGGGISGPTLADVDLLARVNTAEAEGEPYEGKAAVGRWF